MTDYDIVKRGLNRYSFTFGQDLQEKWIHFAYGELLTEYIFELDGSLKSVNLCPWHPEIGTFDSAH
jgi:hypothetical protein